MKNDLLILLILPNLIFSQIEGNINGYIYDSKSQLPIMGANIIIEDTQKGAITDENGFFEIYQIKPQSYNLSVSYIGYQSKKIYNYIVKSKGNQTLEIYLTESIQELEEIVLFENPFKKSKETPLSINTFFQSISSFIDIPSLFSSALSIVTKNLQL